MTGSADLWARALLALGLLPKPRPSQSDHVRGLTAAAWFRAAYQAAGHMKPSAMRKRLVDLDFSEADLRKVGLVAPNLSFGRLSSVDLRGVDLSTAVAEYARLPAARLDSADLRGAQLRDIDLQAAEACAVRFDEAVLFQANARRARFDDSSFRRADLRNADMRWTSGRNTVWEGADLTGADLRGAQLQGAVLAGADLTNADLRGADLTSTAGRPRSVLGCLLDAEAVRSAAWAGDTLREWARRGASFVRLHEFSEEAARTVRATPPDRAPQFRRAVAETIQVFVAYSRLDTEARLQLEAGLERARADTLVDLWWDERIAPGVQWGPEIQARLEEARIVVFLVSPAMLGSRYVVEEEMPRAVARAESGQCAILPVVLADCEWSDLPLARWTAMELREGGATRLEQWATVAAGVEGIAMGLARDESIQVVVPTPEMIRAWLQGASPE